MIVERYQQAASNGALIFIDREKVLRSSQVGCFYCFVLQDQNIIQVYFGDIWFSIENIIYKDLDIVHILAKLFLAKNMEWFHKKPPLTPLHMDRLQVSLLKMSEFKRIN